MATKRWKKWLLWTLALGPVCYSSVVYWRIINQSGHDEAQPADAIIVFGAASMMDDHPPFTKPGSIMRPSFIIAVWRQW